MAIPTSATSGGNVPVLAGIRFAGLPADPTLWTEVQCSTSTGFASSQTRKRKLPPSPSNQVIAQFEVPYSTRLYYGRARHFRVGYTTGPWSTLASGRPAYLKAQMPNPGYYAHHVAKFGTLTSAQAKVQRLQCNFANAAASTRGFTRGAFLQPLTTSSVLVSKAEATWQLPNGVTITNYRIRGLRKAVTSLMRFEFLAVKSSAATTSLTGSRDLSTGAAYHTTGTIGSGIGVNHVVSTNYTYYLEITMRTTALGANTGAAFLYAELAYTMPHIGAAI